MWSLVVSLLLTSARADDPRCGELTLPASDAVPVQLLGDRLRLPLPPGATSSDLPHDVMGPAVPTTEGVLWFLHAGPDRLGLLVQRLHALPTDRFPDEVVDALDPVVQHAPLTAGGLGGIALWTSVAPHGTGGDVPVLDVLLRAADGEILQLSVLTDDETAAHGDVCIDYARALLTGLSPGETRIDRAARTERIGLTAARVLELKLPEDTVVVTRPGPDFRVYDVELLRPITETGVRATLYVGTSPTPIAAGTTTWRGRLARGRVTWTESPGQVEGTHRVEAQRVVEQRTVLHVVVEGPTTLTPRLLAALARARMMVVAPP